MRVCSSGVAMMRVISVCSRSTISFGVPVRANSMCQDTASKSGMPEASANGGTSGSVPSRVVEVTASARSLPLADQRQRRGRLPRR